MENLKRRGLSLLLALVMIVSLFAGIQLPKASAATVDYKYSTDGNQYVYNWGTRGTTATFLSPMAEDWWSTKPAYSTLAAMDGSSNLNTISNSELYKALASIMTNAHTTKTTYDGTRDKFQYTDCQNSAKTTTKISSFYSGTDIGPNWDSGATWNREHVWPNSKSAGGSDTNTIRETDIMMLRPTAKDENGGRSNAAYGESSGYYHPNSESSGTYDLRGDVSRISLYVYVRYGTDSTYADGALNYMWGSTGVMESLDVLLDWMEEDPVDTWEMGRNDAVQSITGTRNVFVDYPELAFLLFDESVPAGYTTPSDGSNTPTSSYTVTLKENGVTVDTLTGNSVELPTATAPEGYTFEGWVTETVEDTEAKPDLVYTGSYVPAADITLHALYSKKETTSGGGSSPEITVSTTIAAYAKDNNWANSTQYKTIDMGNGVTVTASGGGNTGKYYTSGTNWRIYQNENPSVIISAGDKTISTVKITYVYENTGVLTHNGSNVSSGTLVEVNDTSVTFSVGNTGSATNGQARITEIEVVLAGSSGGTTTTYYTTTTCAHADTENVAAEAATCTADGYTAGVYCNDCETYISGHEVIKSEGHKYESVVTPPTADEQGYTTYTCSVCKGSYVDSYVPALGADFTVSFVVPNTVPTIAPVTGNNAGVYLPTAEAPEGYTFVGWVAARVPDTETKPTTVYESGTTTAITQTTTLYALYSYSVGGESDTIVFEFNESTVNDAGKESTSALSSGSFASTDNTKQLVFDSLDKVYYANDKAGNKALKLGSSKASGTFTFSVPTDVAKVIFRVSGRTGKTGVTINGTNYEITTLAFSDSTACEYTTIEVDTPTDRKFEFSTYTPSSGDIRALLDSITYEIPAEGAARFTTELCTHTNTSTVTTVEPTCTEAGEKAEKCSDCGAIISTEAIEALGHNFANNVCTRCGIEQFTVTFVTPAGVTAVNAITFIDGESVTLPDTLTGAPTGGLNGVTYTFVGWSSEIIDNDPDFDTTTSTYYDIYETDPTFEDNTTLYAVYTYTTQDEDGSTGSGTTTEPNNYTVTISEYAAANNWTNGGNQKKIVIYDGLTVTAASTGSNTGYTSASDWRIYQTDKGTLTFTCTNGIISTIKITYNSQNTGCLVYGTANILSEDSVIINAAEATFSVGNTGGKTNGQARITKIEVSVIPSGGGSTPTTTTYYTTVIGETVCEHTGTTVSIDNGYRVETCNSCGATVSRTKLELKFYGASLEVGEGISINYKVAASLFAENLYDLDSAYATFVFNKETEDERTFTVSNPVLSGDYYVFQLKNIRPDWMGDVVTATLTAEDATGESITSEPIDYSVAEYCYNKLNAADSTNALKTLLVDMLNYGAATQEYTGYKTDALVNADLTADQKGWGSDTTKTLTNNQSFSGEAGSVSWKGASLFLRETVRIRLRFAAEDVTGLKVVATVDNNTYELTDFTDAGNGQYYVFFDNLLAYQMRDTVEFTVMNGDTAVSKTLTYSVASYAAAVSESNTTLYNMIHAMMRYGDAVTTYAGK